MSFCGFATGRLARLFGRAFRALYTCVRGLRHTFAKLISHLAQMAHEGLPVTRGRQLFKRYRFADAYLQFAADPVMHFLEQEREPECEADMACELEHAAVLP